MAARSLNKVMLIGNLTRDPELRYTPNGTAVCTFGLATNRQWVTESGERKEDVEFHRIVAWQKLAEICSKFLFKGKKAYLEGRLQTRTWTGQDGKERQSTEIVIEDMIILDSFRREEDTSSTFKKPETEKAEIPVEKSENSDTKEEETKGKASTKEKSKEKKIKPVDTANEDIAPEDIPF
jgi:single-strand DNA-binding protein